MRALLELQVGERPSAPERERLPELRGSPLRRVGRERATALPREPLEAVEVELPGVEAQHVAGRPGDDELLTRGVGVKRLAQARDVRLQRVCRASGRTRAPELVDQQVAGDDLIRVEQEDREQSAL